MPFRRNDEKRQDKRAHEAELQAEVDRLLTLSPGELAVKVLAVVAAETATSKLGRASLDTILSELPGGLKASFHLNVFGLKMKLKMPVLEALQRLEHASLVLQVPGGTDSAATWRVTAEGEKAISAGDLADRLGLST